MFKSVAIKLIAIAALLGFVLVPLTGCREDNSSHVIYIEPDGHVTWRVIQDLMRSDKDDVAERLAEEEEWLDEVDAQEQGWGEILDSFGADEIEQTYLRDTRPYTVVTRATYDNLGDLVVRVDAYCDEDDNVTTLERHDDRWTMTTVVAIDPDEWEHIEDGHVWVLTMIEAQIAASQGRFTEAVGYEISEDGAIATPLPLTPEEVAEKPTEVVYELTWDTTA